MHEWALAEGVITTALKAADDEGVGEITRIEVAIGELQQIEKEIFEYALKEVMPEREPRLATVQIDLHTEPARFRCRVCQREFGFPEATQNLSEEEAEAIHFLPEVAHTFLRCPGCDSTDFEVTKGRGVWVNAVEGR